MRKPPYFAEEISGVFVKNLVPNSAAESNGNIKVHDLIIAVNGSSVLAVWVQRMCVQGTRSKVCRTRTVYVC
jgi:C-terminal processing protease CtpA/Prc